MAQVPRSAGGERNPSIHAGRQVKGRTVDWETLAGATGVVRTLVRRAYAPQAGPEEGQGRFGEHERLEVSKFHAGAAEPLILEDGELPELEGETRLVVMPVDPYEVYAYWDVAPGSADAAAVLLGASAAQHRAVLRFHDITGIDFDGANSVWSFDIDVDLRARSYYVHLWSPGKRYCVELGLAGADARFVALARSNIVETPPAWPQVKAEGAVVRVPPAAAKAAALPLPEVPLPVRLAGAGEVLRRKLAAIEALRDGLLRELTAPGPPPAEDSRYDLTEMSERMFSSGVSSVLLSSSGQE
jgi:hypothetical protein